MVLPLDFFSINYIYAKNFIDYFEHASPSDIDYFISTFIIYIKTENLIKYKQRI